ncbi:hypothetical protein, partial [Streptomyces cinereoruber]|uniref:hypothetical protein n=1 Tax=Streptomyces cinereoruber TaxID=67260 RepID=UPI003650D314
MSVEEFGLLLANPFSGGAVNPQQGRDPAAACLQAIGHGDWDNALQWAAWASNGPVTPAILTDALHQTTFALGIDITAYPDITHLAADFAAHTDNDTQALHLWTSLLTHNTHHPTQVGWRGTGLNHLMNTLAQTNGSDTDPHQPDPHHLILDGSDPAGSWTTTGQDPAQAGWTDGWAGEWADGELDHLMTTLTHEEPAMPAPQPVVQSVAGPGRPRKRKATTDQPPTTPYPALLTALDRQVIATLLAPDHRNQSLRAIATHYRQTATTLQYWVEGLGRRLGIGGTVGQVVQYVRDRAQ